MLRPPHLKLIARHSVRHGLRGGAGLIAVLATLLIGLLLTSIVISPLDAVEQQLNRHSELDAQEVAAYREQAGREVIKIAKGTTEWAMGVSDEQIDYLLGDKPAMISALLILLMLVVPLCACLGAFNQTSGDIGSKGLRYLLIRTERQNIFIGRFIGTAIFTAFVFLVLFLILALYIGLKVHVHPTGDMLLWLAGGYVRIVLFSLPYVALCAWVSGSIDSPFGALVLAMLFAYLWPLFVFIGTRQNEGFHYLQYATPWGYKWWLFSESPGMVAGGVAVMLAFTAALVVLGNYRFAKRDL
ncbi:MAG TPA: ABC transporter permease subunit [Kofleriaceae bacterium]|nr:ABC transporter permease subunit [Kofleriaceae bacterium]